MADEVNKTTARSLGDWPAEPSCMAAGVAVALTVLIVLSLMGGLLWSNGRERRRAPAYHHVCRRYRTDDDDDATEGFETPAKSSPGALAANKPLDAKSHEVLQNVLRRAAERRGGAKPRAEGFTAPAPKPPTKRKGGDLQAVRVSPVG